MKRRKDNYPSSLSRKKALQGHKLIALLKTSSSFLSLRRVYVEEMMNLIKTFGSIFGEHYTLFPDSDLSRSSFPGDKEKVSQNCLMDD
jgi:hypothetical protein